METGFFHQIICFGIKQYNKTHRNFIRHHFHAKIQNGRHAIIKVIIYQGSHGHEKSWKTMENEKKKSRPGKVIENENLGKNHGKVMGF